MLEDLFPYLIMLVLAVAFIVVVTFLAKKISNWQKNNQSEKLTVDATVISTRSKATYQHNGELYHPKDTSRYYATFKLDSGEIREFEITVDVSNALIEFESGKLTYQGTRFVSFEHNH